MALEVQPRSRIAHPVLLGVASGIMGDVKLLGVILFGTLTLGACAGTDTHEARRPVSVSSTSTTADVRPLDCPNGRFETAQADFYGEEPMTPYEGEPTPEAALGEYVREPISGYSRVSERDPAWQYFQPSADQAVFVRVDSDGRRTMSVLIRPSSAGGWQGAAHIACEGPPGGR
ncbi:MAG: hypothetical protein LC792_11880 [Actinobacteria bacterium]|nr:hypothetical protein [Actinomycetota bacterium]